MKFLSTSQLQYKYKESVNQSESNILEGCSVIVDIHADPEGQTVGNNIFCSVTC